jgi:hypothetical protein
MVMRAGDVLRFMAKMIVSSMFYGVKHVETMGEEKSEISRSKMYLDNVVDKGNSSQLGRKTVVVNQLLTNKNLLTTLIFLPN